MSPEAVFAASLPIGCVATVIGCSLTVTVFTRLCGPRVHGRPCALSPGRSLGASLVGGAIGVVFVTPLINALLHQLSGGAWGRDGDLPGDEGGRARRAVLGCRAGEPWLTDLQPDAGPR